MGVPLEQVHRHLTQLSKLARTLAITMRISLGRAPCHLRHTGDAIALYTGNDIPAVTNAGEVCAHLERKILG